MSAAVGGKKPGDVSLAKIVLGNLLLLLLFTGAGWLFFSPFMAWSIFAGGAVANGSFLLLKKDLVALLRGAPDVARGRFFIRYYLRLAAMGAVLFLLVRYRQVQWAGLLLGLSTVPLSIVLVVVAAAKDIYGKKNA